jgi:hypothetical protein
VWKRALRRGTYSAVNAVSEAKGADPMLDNGLELKYLQSHRHHTKMNPT